MEVDERGDAFRGIPKLWILGVLRLSWGCHGNPQAQALATPCSIIHQILTQNLKTSQHKTQNRKLVSSVSERKQKNTSRYCNELIIYLYGCYTYCIPTSLWITNYFTSHRFIKISKQHTKNRNVKNRTVCSNLQLAQDLEPQKF